MLKCKNISNGFWVEAISTTIYLKNQCPTKILDHKTPFEDLYGYKLTVIHLRIFGRKTFSHVPKEDRRKLDAKQSSAFLLVIVLIIKHISCLILPHIIFFQVEMCYFMSMQMKAIRIDSYDA
jgi:hypothetical protein